MTYEEGIETLTRNIRLCLDETLAMMAEYRRLAKAGDTAASQRAAGAIAMNVRALFSLRCGLERWRQ